jgi:hypothetical protein
VGSYGAAGDASCGEAYLVVREGVCLRHVGGGVWGLLGYVGVSVVVQLAEMLWWSVADDGAWRVEVHGPQLSGRRLAIALGWDGSDYVSSARVTDACGAGMHYL